MQDLNADLNAAYAAFDRAGRRVDSPEYGDLLAAKAAYDAEVVRIPNDIAEHFGLPEFVSREEFRKIFPHVPLDGDTADWSAYADLFRAYADHRTVVNVSANRLALVLAPYGVEQARIHASFR